jgi:hypothetical protein
MINALTTEEQKLYRNQMSGIHPIKSYLLAVSVHLIASLFINIIVEGVGDIAKEYIIESMLYSIIWGVLFIVLYLPSAKYILRRKIDGKPNGNVLLDDYDYYLPCNKKKSHLHNSYGFILIGKKKIGFIQNNKNAHVNEIYNSTDEQKIYIKVVLNNMVDDIIMKEKLDILIIGNENDKKTFVTPKAEYIKNLIEQVCLIQ